MEEKRIIELLEFISENNRIFINENDLIKKFKREEIDFCHQCGLIIRDNLHPNYLLTNNGINFLMGYYMSENTKKLNKSIEDFSKKSEKSSGIMIKYNKRLFILTGLLILLSLIMIAIPIILKYVDTNEKIYTTIAQIDSLDLELQKILEGIEILENQKETFEKDRTPFKFALENLQVNSFNPNIRNGEIENRIKILYNRMLQINVFVESGNSGVYSYFNETKEVINNLRTLFPSYKNCIIKERNFNKC